MKVDIRSTIHATNYGCPPTNSPALVGEDMPKELEPMAQPKQKPRRNVAIQNVSKHFDDTFVGHNRPLTHFNHFVSSQIILLGTMGTRVATYEHRNSHF
jgi:hypothetical protein